MKPSNQSQVQLEREAPKSTAEANAIDKRVSTLLAQMRPAEKFAQMAQVEKNSISADLVLESGIGSVLSGGGGNPSPNTPENWRKMVLAFDKASRQSRLGIPIIYGTDAVHGHNNLAGATIFPHNVGLGATGDAELIEKIGRITALEVAATGARWNFAPAVSVARDIRWGRTFESYSQDPALVSRLGAAYVRGSHGDQLDNPSAVLASVKHFIGDGGTAWDSTSRYPWIGDWWTGEGDRWKIDQGACEFDEAELRAVHLPPYYDAVAAGARNIMVSYSSWDGIKMHAHHYLLTDVLKGELGFTGFLVSDWLGANQLSADYYEAVVTAINAGLDMLMLPYDLMLFVTTMNNAVVKGDIAMSRVDDAVSRILRVKFEMGLFDIDDEQLPALELIGCPAHRAVAYEAARKSAVLLKNDGAVLPLPDNGSTWLVAGAGADDIGLQCGGWTIEWQGGQGRTTDGTTILEGLQAGKSPNTTLVYDTDGQFDAAQTGDVGIVVLSEAPYAEGEGDSNDLTLTKAESELLHRVAAQCNKIVVVLLAGRPRIVTEHLDNIDALVAAWLPGSEANGISDVLLGKHPFSGKLSFAWPREASQIPYSANDTPLWDWGHGLTT